MLLMTQSFGSYSGNNVGSYSGSNNANVFAQAKEEAREFVFRDVEGGHGSDVVVSEYDILDHCRQKYSILVSFGIAFFVKSLLEALINAGTQFGFCREGKRSLFFGIKLKDFEPTRSEETGRQDWFASFPQEEKKDHINSDEDISNFLGEDILPSYTPNITVSKESTQCDKAISSADNADDSATNWIWDYTQRDPRQNLSLSKLKKVFAAVVTDKSQSFEEFRDKLLANSKDLSVVEGKSKSGKPMRYIVGLALSDKGKAKLEG
jgi:hypothetical protein